MGHAAGRQPPRKGVPADPVYFPVPNMDSFPCSPSDIDVEVGDILEVWERTRDDRDRRLLRVINYWRDRELSVTFWGYACRT